MALKNNWKDKINNESIIDAKDINDIAHAVIDLEDEQQEAVKGENGATFIPSVSANGVISWTNDRNLPNPTPVNIKGGKGDKGDRGEKGNDGYTPRKGIDYFDGVDGKNGQNGKDGQDGYTPIKGKDYFDGEDGKDGYTPIKGVDYFDGKDGKNGKDGYTPIKGTDYFTTSDKAEIVSDVLSALPIYKGEVVTE